MHEIRPHLKLLKCVRLNWTSLSFHVMTQPWPSPGLSSLCAASKQCQRLHMFTLEWEGENFRFSPVPDHFGCFGASCRISSFSLMKCSSSFFANLNLVERMSWPIVTVAVECPLVKERTSRCCRTAFLVSHRNRPSHWKATNKSDLMKWTLLVSVYRYSFE